jgi:hypothetical protein
VRKRADLIRWGHVIVGPTGRTAKVVNVKRIASEALGPLIEITLDTGETMRRPPGTKLDVVRSR